MQQNAQNNPSKHQDDASKTNRKEGQNQQKGNPSDAQKVNQPAQNQPGRTQDESDRQRDNRQNEKTHDQTQTSKHGG